MENDFKNVVIISIDALRSDCIAANPHKELLEKFSLKAELKTPILDGFLKNGTFFSNCITAAPYTTTSHASILTGQWPDTHKLQHFFRNKLESENLFEILKKEGFATLSQVDFASILGPMLGFTNGVDTFIRKKDSESLKWIKEHVNDRKLCFFHFGNVHVPYGFSSDLGSSKLEINKFANLTFALAKKYKIPLSSHGKKQDSLYASRRSALENMLSLVYGKILDKLHSDGSYDEIMDLYVEGINYFEKNRFHKFINGLEKLGIMENSLFVVLSDHGELWSRESKGHFGKECVGDALRDDIIKVPVIFFGKGVPKGMIINNQIRTVDIVPTILSLLGIKKKEKMFDGESLTPLGKIKGDGPAYAQAWSTGDNLEALSFRKNAIEKQKTSKEEFPVHLLQESFRDGKKKIVRHFDSLGRVTKVKYFDVSIGEKEFVCKKMECKKLISEFESFKKKIHKNKKGKTLLLQDQEKIKRELRSLGY